MTTPTILAISAIVLSSISLCLSSSKILRKRKKRAAMLSQNSLTSEEKARQLAEIIAAKIEKYMARNED